jgi:hypothetical protein
VTTATPDAPDTTPTTTPRTTQYDGPNKTGGIPGGIGWWLLWGAGAFVAYHMAQAFHTRIPIWLGMIVAMGIVIVVCLVIAIVVGGVLRLFGK